MASLGGYEQDDINREQLELLKAKFDVLQGERRAYFDTYEQTKRTNEQLLRDLRDRQKELQKQLVDAQKRTRGPGSKAAVAGADEQKVADELIRKRAEYDKLKNRSQALRLDLDKLLGDLSAIRNVAGVAAGGKGHDGSRRGSKDATKLSDLLGDDLDESQLMTASTASSAAMAAMKDTPLMKRAKAVEARLDKTALKYEEVSAIRKTYEGIVKRLRDERQGYDSQVSALEKELTAKTKDFNELQTLAADAVRALESSQTELTRVKSAAGADRERQSRELRERQGMAKARRKHAEAQMARERARADLLAEVAGDLGVSEEKALVASVDAARAQRNSLMDQAGVVKRKLEAYESAWRRIREATGVSEIGEVTAKMASQVEQHASLAALSRDNAVRLESLREEISAFSRLVQELRFTSGEGDKTNAAGGADGASPDPSPDNAGDGASEAGTADASVTDTVDDGPRVSEAALVGSAASRVENLKEQQARLSSKLVELRMGVAHLVESLSHARHSLGSPAMDTVTSDNMAEAVRDAGATLRQMMRLIARHAVASGHDLLEPYGGLLMDEPEVTDLANEDDFGSGDMRGVARVAGERAANSSVAMTDGPGDARAKTPNRRQSVAAAAIAAAALSPLRPDTPGGTGMSTTFARIVPSPQALAAMGLRDEDLVAARSYNNRVAPSALTGVNVAALTGGLRSPPPKVHDDGHRAKHAGHDGQPSPHGNEHSSRPLSREQEAAIGRLAGMGIGSPRDGTGSRPNSRGRFEGAAAPAPAPGEEGAPAEGEGVSGGVMQDGGYALPDPTSEHLLQGDVDLGQDGQDEDEGADGTLSREAIKRQSKRTADAHKPRAAGGPVLRRSKSKGGDGEDGLPAAVAGAGGKKKAPPRYQY